jgi:hypothetical protein
LIHLDPSGFRSRPLAPRPEPEQYQ